MTMKYVLYNPINGKYVKKVRICLGNDASLTHKYVNTLQEATFFSRQQSALASLSHNYSKNLFIPHCQQFEVICYELAPYDNGNANGIVLVEKFRLAVKDKYPIK